MTDRGELSYTNLQNAVERRHAFKARTFVKWLHFFAGLLFLVLAVSHFLMANVASPVQHSINTVFPFFTFHSIFLLAGVYELAMAIMCLKWRGRDSANLAILIFILVMVWYRWALNFTGGEKNCECLGILGRALHLTKYQEKIAPIIILVILSLIILPWLVLRIIHGLKRIVRSLRVPSQVVQSAILFILLSEVAAKGGQTIEITGQYNSYHYNAATGQLFTNYTRHVVFTCVLSGNARAIYATNVDDSPDGLGLRTPWEGMVYDGTCTYTFMPFHVEVGGRSWTVEPEVGKGSSVRATISPGPIFLRDYDEYLDFYAVWLAYGLCPSNVPPNAQGIVEIPLPWHVARSFPSAYGFNWKMSPTKDGQFVSECRVINDNSLIKSDQEELSRKELTPPRSLPDHNHFTEELQNRRLIPDGATQAVYKCSGFYVTNGLVCPAASELIIYNDYLTNNVRVKVEIQLTKVTVHPDEKQLLASVSSQTLVADYRYRRHLPDGRIVADLEYVLHPGDSWKSDAELPQLSEHLAIVGADPQYSGDKRRSIFTWLLLALAIVPIGIVLKSNKNKETYENKTKE